MCSLSDTPLCTDSRAAKTFVDGNSNGGMMLYTMYCKSKIWAKYISGYMIHSGGIGYDWLMAQCRPPRAVPLLQLHGGLDPVIPLRPTQLVDGVKFATQSEWSPACAIQDCCLQQGTLQGDGCNVMQERQFCT
jgi:poly(3-hydroxybutyrate) depolymerase